MLQAEAVSLKTMLFVPQHAGGLWGGDGADVLAHGLRPEEAGEGFSHDQQ